MDRIVPYGPEPAEVFTREQLRAALAEVRARSGLSLTEIANRSGELTRANRARTFSSAGRRLVQLTRTNVSGFTTASQDRLQLPGEDALVTFLLLTVWTSTHQGSGWPWRRSAATSACAR